MAFRVLVVLLGTLACGGCNSYPNGMTRAEWQQAPAEYRARLRADVAKETREIERNRIPDGPIQRAVIQDDERNRRAIP